MSASPSPVTGHTSSGPYLTYKAPFSQWQAGARSIRRVVQSARTTHILLLLLLVLLRNSDLTRMIDLAAHHPPAVVRIAAAASSSSGTSSTRSSSGSSPHARTAPHRNLRMHLASRIAHLACPPLPPSTLARPESPDLPAPGEAAGAAAAHLHSTPPRTNPQRPSPSCPPMASRAKSHASHPHPFTDPGPRRAPFWPPLVQEQPRDGVSTLKTNLLSSSPMASHRFGRALADVTVT